MIISTIGFFVPLSCTRMISRGVPLKLVLEVLVYVH